MPQINPSSFVFYPGITKPDAPALGVNAARQFLQVINNGASGTVRVKFDTNFTVPANEVQSLVFAPSPNAGTFTVTDWLGNTTAALAYNISAADLQTALEGLGAIGGGNVTVTGTVAAGFVITFIGTLALTAIPDDLDITSSLTNTTGQQNCVQNIQFSAEPTAGTYKLQGSAGNKTTALAFNASEAAILAALNLLPEIANSVTVVTKAATTIAVTFGAAPLAHGPVALLAVTDSTLTNNTVLTNCVQVLYMEPAPLQGTFKLQDGAGNKTAAMPYTVTAPAMQAALEAVPTIGAGNVSVAGSAFDTGFAITFHTALGHQAVDLLSVQESTLHPDILTGVQKRVTDDVEMLVTMAVPGQGPVAATATVSNSQAGIAPLTVAATVTVTTPGQAQVVEGTPITAGNDHVWDVGVPVSAMYAIADETGIPVNVVEG